MAAEAHGNNDLQAHEATYSGFLSLFRVGTAAALFTAAIVILLIAH